MTLITRRILASFFVVVFFITTPIVLLYTSGYRYNFTKNKLEKTGVLFLDSEPSGATIRIGNKMLKKKTPAHLTALLPGEYGVELKKDGYLAWEKALTVESAKTVFATGVFLPRANDPASVFALDVEDIDLSPSQKMLLTRKLVGTKTVFGLYNIDEKKSTVLGLFETLDKSVEVQWSPDSSLIIVRVHTTPKQFLIIDVAGKSILSTGPFFDTPIQNIKIDYNAQNILIVGTARGRFRFNVETKTKTLIDTKNYDDYVVGGGLLYAVEQNLNETNLVSLSVSTEDPRPTVVTILPRGSYQFLPSPDNFILLKDTKGLLILVELGERPEIILEDQADQISWKKSDTAWELLYHRNFELWLFHTSTREKELITRLSTPIKKSIFFSDDEYALFFSHNAVRLIELDKRGGRNIWTLGGLYRISDFALDSNKLRIYFVGQSAADDNQMLYSRETR